MRKQSVPLNGFCYLMGKTVEVYVKLANGKFLKLEGNADEAKRSFGKMTRKRAKLKYGFDEPCTED